MARKARSQRRRQGDEDGGEDASISGVKDALSESHTIASQGNSEVSWEDWNDDAAVWGAEETTDDMLLGGAGDDIDAAAAAADARQERLLEALHRVAEGEFATEKRTARRETGLRLVFKALTQYATGRKGQDLVYERHSNIVVACQHSLRVGSPSEQYAACRVLEATSVILGVDADAGGGFYETIYTMLWRTMHSKSKATQVRVAALRALTMANFIGNADDVTTEQLLDICEQAAMAEYRGAVVPTALRATALDSWALLSTTIDNLYIAGKDDVSTGRGLLLLPMLKDCLEDANVQLRTSAGLCLALIHESRLALGTQDEAATATERQFRPGTWEDTEWQVVVDECRQRISELAVESSHYMSKRAKKEQRATFREFSSMLVDDEPPHEVVTFRGGMLDLECWRDIVQLQWIRHCLQGGFQVQLLTNTTIQTIFKASGAAVATLERYSQLEKRIILSKTSDAAKAADIDLTRKRRQRTNVKNHFLTADGEDI